MQLAFDPLIALKIRTKDLIGHQKLAGDLSMVFNTFSIIHAYQPFSGGTNTLCVFLIMVAVLLARTKVHVTLAAVSH